MTKEQGRFTGRHFFVILLTAFGVIIGANVTLAVFATGSFPGLDVKNTYVASQQFDQKKQAQLALGWQTEAAYKDGLLRLFITDATGQPVRPARLSLLLRRPTSAQEDKVLTPQFETDHIRAAVTLATGYWQLVIDAQSENGVLFSQSRNLVLK